jgi:demethylmenaquinone methyltransferase/2-methoxy-6-polyprenyl-1,4-benzoquinol methylase
MKEKETVQKMFNDISSRYDFLNHFLSLGIDILWRKKFVRILSGYKPSRILDVATGTGDLAFCICSLRPDHVTGIDIAAGMLAIAKEKAIRKGLKDTVEFLEADAENIPFPEGSFDAVTVAFGVRNFADLEKGLLEMKRILRPGGVMMILEFSHPSRAPWKQLYSYYSRKIIPLAGKLISGHREAYTYLPSSVAAFPSGADLIAILDATGLKNASFHTLTFGIATIYVAEK